MKKYEKPTLEVVQIRVEEDIAKKDVGNTTAYKLSNGAVYMGMSSFPESSL